MPWLPQICPSIARILSRLNQELCKVEQTIFEELIEELNDLTML